MADTPTIEFRDAEFDTGAGATLLQAMRDEMRELYDGLDMDSDEMPRAGAAELGPPTGALIVGWFDGEPVCVGGVKRLDERACEIKRMYVVTGLARARGGAGAPRRARGAGAPARVSTARLDTGPARQGARGCTSRRATPRSRTSTPILSTSFGARKALGWPASVVAVGDGLDGYRAGVVGGQRRQRRAG